MSYRYKWLDELYKRHLDRTKREPTKEDFKIWYLRLLRNKRYELASAGELLRLSLAGQRGMLKLNTVMEKGFKELLRENKISKVNWMYH